MKTKETFDGATPRPQARNLPSEASRKKRAGRARSKRDISSEFGKKTRVLVAIIYALTTVIPFLVLLYIIHLTVFLQEKVSPVWIGSLALTALIIALLGGKLLKKIWEKLVKTVQTIDRFHKESGTLADGNEIESAEEIDLIPTVVNRLVDIARRQRNELTAHNERVRLLDNTLKKAKERILKMTRDDPLTGLYNRKHFNESLGREIARTKRYQRNLALAMIDVDSSEPSDDGRGTAVGEKALAIVGETIRRSIRRIDLPFRYGEERFAIVFPETTAENATFATERIRRAVENHGVPGEFSHANGALTVSVGVSTLGRGCRNLEDLVAEAERALYKAKSVGPNRVVSLAPD